LTYARGHLEAGLATLRDHGAGVRWEIDIGDTFWLATLFYLGEWREMARLTQVLLREASDRGDVVAQQGLRTGRCNFAWLLIDRPDEAAAQLATASQTLSDGFHLPHVQLIVAQVNSISTGPRSRAPAGRGVAEHRADRRDAAPAAAHRANPRVRARCSPTPPTPSRTRRGLADAHNEAPGWARIGHLRAPPCSRNDNDDARMSWRRPRTTSSHPTCAVNIVRRRCGTWGAGGLARAEAARDRCATSAPRPDL
jgi:hypothetical protein